MFASVNNPINKQACFLFLPYKLFKQKLFHFFKILGWRVLGNKIEIYCNHESKSHTQSVSFRRMSWEEVGGILDGCF